MRISSSSSNNNNNINNNNTSGQRILTKGRIARGVIYQQIKTNPL